MLSGGMIQLLLIYQTEMEVLATVAIIAISAFIYIEYFWRVKVHILKKSDRKEQIRNFTLWLVIVFILSMAVENVGVISGSVFGNYTYGPVLSPFVGGVPLAIGFAWINTLVPAMMIAKRFMKQDNELNKWYIAVISGLLMVTFDIILEKAAIELNYWYWEDGIVPFQNYLAWFILGFIFARIGMYLKVDRYGLPSIYQHIFLAQMGYFILVIIR
jgi:putative membrane protein